MHPQAVIFYAFSPLSQYREPYISNGHIVDRTMPGFQTCVFRNNCADKACAMKKDLRFQQIMLDNILIFNGWRTD